MGLFCTHELQFCCISKTLAAEGHKFQTMTWARFSKLPREKAVAIVSERTLNNLRVTRKILEQCADRGWGYRVSSALFPLLTYDVAELKLEDYPDYADIMATFADCASIIKDRRIRISCHPDQFNVLASLGQAQVEKTIKELNHHGWLMDMLGAHRDYRCPINIHVNNTKGDPAEIANRFMMNLYKCDEAVRSRLVVENEDKGIWTPNCLQSILLSQLPMTICTTNVCLTVLQRIKLICCATALGIAKVILSRCFIIQNHIQTKQSSQAMPTCLQRYR